MISKKINAKPEIKEEELEALIVFAMGFVVHHTETNLDLDQHHRKILYNSDPKFLADIISGMIFRSFMSNKFLWMRLEEYAVPYLVFEILWFYFFPEPKPEDKEYINELLNKNSRFNIILENVRHILFDCGEDNLKFCGASNHIYFDQSDTVPLFKSFPCEVPASGILYPKCLITFHGVENDK